MGRCSTRTRRVGAPRAPRYCPQGRRSTRTARHLLLALRAPPPPGRPQMREHRVEVSHAEFEHERLIVAPEVIRILERGKTAGPSFWRQTPLGGSTTPRVSAYYPRSASGSSVRKNIPPIPVTFFTIYLPSGCPCGAPPSRAYRNLSPRTSPILRVALRTCVRRPWAEVYLIGPSLLLAYSVGHKG